MSAQLASLAVLAVAAYAEATLGALLTLHGPVRGSPVAVPRAAGAVILVNVAGSAILLFVLGTRVSRARVAYGIKLPVM